MLERNARILRQVKQMSSCKILLAQKAFACYPLYDMLSRYLDGAASSGLYEARLAREEMGEDCEVHVYAPAYDEREFDDYLGMVDTMVFNSFEQWERFREKVFEHNLSGGRQISCGLRINPGYSEVEVDLYDAASSNSRLGVSAEDFKIGYEKGRFDGLSGIHFHSLCQQNADVLERTLDAIRESFGPWPKRLSWINFGGGHHITKEGYDLDLLVKLIRRTADETGATVYLEPGEAVALDAGWLVASVLDLVKKPDYVIAILNASAACHMPDVLEMPYTPRCFIVPSSGRSSSVSVWYEGVEPGVKPYNIQLAGPTCLAGDVIGTYSFDVPPLPGDRIVLTDMAIYTMVKNNTFNGMPLPSIMLQDKKGNIVKLKRFGYEDFKGRLG
jgi:carboxynorspermidine decarboxylase